jgi:hypothetical protein
MGRLLKRRTHTVARNYRQSIPHFKVVSYWRPEHSQPTGIAAYYKVCSIAPSCVGFLSGIPPRSKNACIINVKAMHGQEFDIKNPRRQRNTCDSFLWLAAARNRPRHKLEGSDQPAARASCPEGSGAMDSSRPLELNCPDLQELSDCQCTCSVVKNF